MKYLQQSINVNLELIREKRSFQACLVANIGSLAELEADLTWLHPEEFLIYQSFRYERRKLSYLLGRFAAKSAISGLNERVLPNTIWIDKGVFGFPVVKGLPNIQVSISHSDNKGFAVAFPEGHPIGVDIERISERHIEAVDTQLTKKERELFDELSVENSYFACFSMKEALSKVLRTGMMIDFKLLEINGADYNDGLLRCKFSHFGQYKAYAMLKGDYVFSIVLPERTDLDLYKFGNDLDTLLVECDEKS